MSQPGEVASQARELLTECDREPIHIPGSIQPHGCLAICSAGDWRLSHVSQSVERLFGVKAEDALAQHASRLFGANGVETLRRLLDGVAAPGAGERFFRVSSPDWREDFDIAVHLNGGRIEFEFEPSFPVTDHAPPSGTPLGLVKAVTARLAQASEFGAFCDLAARQLKVITGFDRVMVYRFADDGSGEVIAEAKRPDMDPFLGLHYPAGDIPQQARRLYLENPIRAIADVDAEPSPILSFSEAADEPVDMTFIGLRSVSPIHIQYLKNMSVGASMSLSIIRDGALWGLFACHHDQPKLVSAEARAACELLSQLFSLQIEARERAETASAQRDQRLVIDGLRKEIHSADDLPTALAAVRSKVDQLIECGGVATVLGEEIGRSGSTPGERLIRKIVDALPQTSIWSSDSLADALPGCESEDAAGLLAIPVSGEPGDFLLLFRKELARTVAWAGRSNKSTPEEILTPRKSFEVWTEVVRDRSSAWSAEDHDAGEALRGLMLELALRRSDALVQFEKDARARQELLISELNHRVKNILSLVRSLARGGKNTSQSVEDFVAELFGRLDALSAAHDQALGDSRAALPLRRLLENELAPYSREGGPSFELEGEDLSVARRAVALVALAFHELATNAAKYGALSVPEGRVSVKWFRRNDGAVAIEWTEAGGPEVAPPGKTGFGSTLIDRTWRLELKGACDIAYAPTGLTACLTLPSDAVNAADESPQTILSFTPAPSVLERTGRPASFVALLVEDSAIIALDLDDLLREVGASDVIHVTNVADAQAALDRAAPDFALLDVNLGSETSLPIAERLTMMKAPFAFSTGYGEDTGLAARFGEVPVLNKPFSAVDIEAALEVAFSNFSPGK